MTTRHLAALAAAVLALTLTACSTPVTETDTEPLPSKPATATQPAPDETTFGGKITYDDGLTVSLGKPEKYTPSPTAMTTGDAPLYVRIKVTVINGTDARFDPALVGVSVSSGDTEGAPVFDNGAGISATPTTAIRPGSRISWDVAFGVTDLDSMTGQVTPDFKHDAAIFTGGTK